MRILSGKNLPVRHDSGYVEDGTHQDEIDFLSTIPTEITLRIFKFLGVKELCLKIPRLNRYLASLSNDEFIWKALCEEKWSTKKHTPMTLHPRADFCSVLHDVGILSDEEIKGILKARFVDMEEYEIAGRKKLERLLQNTVPKGCEYVGCR